jgi:hypothetical protein
MWKYGTMLQVKKHLTLLPQTAEYMALVSLLEGEVNKNELVVASKLLSNGSVNALPGNRYVLNNRRIVGSGVFFAVCSEAT